MGRQGSSPTITSTLFQQETCLINTHLGQLGRAMVSFPVPSRMYSPLQVYIRLKEGWAQASSKVVFQCGNDVHST